MESGTKPFWASKWYIVYLILTAGVIGIWIYANCVLHVCFVSGESMMPTFNDGDVLECQVDFLPNEVKRGDVVVLDTCNGQLVKRVIALPEESLFVKNGQIYICKDGESFLSGYEFEEIDDPGVIPHDGEMLALSSSQYFCVGDNRNHSVDCRDIGPVNAEQIKRIVIKKIFQFL